MFAVEFDGRFHDTAQQKIRDAKKDELCSIFEFPLLRINSNHLLRRYNKRSLLRWIVSAWRLQDSFAEAQRNGCIPLDEDFDPIWIHHHGTSIEEVHPHWISLRGRLHLQKLHEQQGLPHGTSSGFIFTDREDNYHGIEWIDVADGNVVSIDTAMKRQNFPLYLGELFDELLFVLAYEKLIRYFKIGEGAVVPARVEQQLNEFAGKHKFCGSHGGGTIVSVRTTLESGGFVVTAGAARDRGISARPR